MDDSMSPDGSDMSEHSDNDSDAGAFAFFFFFFFSQINFGSFLERQREG
jgi:hypothetical protein